VYIYLASFLCSSEAHHQATLCQWDMPMLKLRALACGTTRSSGENIIFGLKVHC
jgi:hypothetical protein